MCTNNALVWVSTFLILTDILCMENLSVSKYRTTAMYSFCCTTIKCCYILLHLCYTWSVVISLFPEHPWLQNAKKAPNIPLGDVVKSRLKQFSMMNRFKRKALRVGWLLLQTFLCVCCYVVRFNARTNLSGTSNRLLRISFPLMKLKTLRRCLRR